MIATIGLLFGLAAGAQPGLVLDLSAPKREVLVGEPVKLVLRLKATRDVAGVPLDGDALPVHFVRFLVDDGGHVSTYLEYQRQIEERVLVAANLRAGDQRFMNFVLFNGGHVGPGGPPTSGFLFPTPGRFSVRVIYAGQRETVQSNAVRFDVKAPSGEDLAILEAVRREPRILEGNGDAAAQLKAKELVDRFPQSPYLRWAKLRLLQEKANSPDRDLDPETVEHLRAFDAAGLERRRVAEYERMTEELLSKGTDWRPFEEEALAVGILAAQGAGNQQKAQEAKSALYARYPSSATAKRLKAEEGSSGDTADDHEPLIRPVKKPSRKPNQ